MSGDRDELVREFGRVVLEAIEQIREAWERVEAELSREALTDEDRAMATEIARGMLALGLPDPGLMFLSGLTRSEPVEYRWQTDPAPGDRAED